MNLSQRYKDWIEGMVDGVVAKTMFKHDVVYFSKYFNDALIVVENSPFWARTK